MRTLTLVIVLCCPVIAADPQEEQKAMTDQQVIQGTWELVSGQRHGKAFSEDIVKNVTLTFAADVLSTRNKDRANDAKFKLHPGLAPKGIDLVMEGKVGEGIYAIEGDELKILHGEVGDRRPSKFDPQESPTLTMLVLKRKKN